MAVRLGTPLPDGTEIGHYRIVRKIASGGFSIVYLARDASGREVAVKEYMPASLARREPGRLAPRIDPASLPTYLSGLKCFFEEGRALARIAHPNVVRVLDFVRANDTVYLVMEWASGRSLQDVLHSALRASVDGAGPVPGAPLLPPALLRRVFGQVAAGLREVHAARLLHLDLKPANIYLRDDGSVTLLDFGAARRALAHDAPQLLPMYTPGFAAPELQHRGAPLGPWTDLYGFGASLHAALVGRPPAATGSGASGEPVAPAAGGSRLLAEIADWCLRPDPLDRPQGVLVLQRLLRGEGGDPDRRASQRPARPIGDNAGLP